MPVQLHMHMTFKLYLAEAHKNPESARAIPQTYKACPAYLRASHIKERVKRGHSWALYCEHCAIIATGIFTKCVGADYICVGGRMWWAKAEAIAKTFGISEHETARVLLGHVTGTWRHSCILHLMTSTAQMSMVDKCFGVWRWTRD